jgi:hypothetical protein
MNAISTAMISLDDMSDGLDDDPEWVVGVRRMREAMESRPKRERWLIEENERMWRIQAAKQEANKEIINAALVMLLKAMPNLHRVEIGLWHVATRDWNFRTCTIRKPFIA